MTLIRSSSFLITFTALMLFLPFATHAQNLERIFKGYTEYPSYLEITTSDGKIAITPFSNKIIEVQFLTQSQPANKPSYAVVKTTEKPKAVLTNNKNTLTYRTSGISIEIIKQPFQIKYAYLEKPIMSEQIGYFEEDNLSGFKFNLDSSEVIYGGGARALKMNRRGYSLPLYNTPAYGYTDEREDMYFSIPLVISSKQYMILFDNAAKGVLDTGKVHKNILSMHSIGGRKVYYVIAGDSFLDLNTQYTDLTGRQPLPPRWALGNIASRFGYHDQKETEDTVALYKQKSVPIDAVVIDLFWFGKDIKGHMGNLDWDGDAWPKPTKMMRKFNKQGVNTVLITEPFILNTSKRWQEALDADILTKNYRGEPYVFDFYFGTGGLIDIFKPEAKQWFWNIYKEHMDSGVSAWWGDLGEPESHASDMVHINGTADYVHNVFGHEWAKTLYEGYAKDYPKRRPMALMRAGFAGSQRYGMMPWSGDVSRNWEGFKSQPTLALQMGMQGLAYSHSDLGGFAPHRDENDVLFTDPMLYTRWLQYGVFQPIFRPHSHESSPAEPVFWDDKTLRLTREAINLRYQLLPYNYTLAYDNSIKGYPFMRPLFYAEPENTALYEYNSTYLWGDNILVAPVLTSQQKTQQVYFPKESNWVDFYTDKKYSGGTTQNIGLVEDYIPTFIRAGEFIPMLPKGLQTTKNYTTKTLEVLYYIDNNAPSSSYTLYDDDGVTHNAVNSDIYELLHFVSTTENQQHKFTISSNRGKFKGKPKTRYISFIVKQMKTIPAIVTIDGNNIPVLSNSAEEIKNNKQYALKTDDHTLKIKIKFQSKKIDIVF